MDYRIEQSRTMEHTSNHTKKPTILIADDDRKIRQTLSDILSFEGYDIIEAVNGEQVIHAVTENNPDVILLDIYMPKRNGLEITQLIKADMNLHHIPIVIITGQNDLDIQIQALHLGADDYLEKPLHFTILKARIGNLVKVKSYHDYMKNHQIILESQIQERTKQLENTMQELKFASLDTILRLSRAVEFRDENTSAHLTRISRYASIIAKMAGLGSDIVETISHTTPLHDIGKIAIPDKILLKPGKLNAKEWKLMKQHTLFGMKILKESKSRLLQMGAKIALTHHEKWDGTGYPARLKAEAIPMEGRITAIADVFDAFTSKRPYKTAFPPEKGFALISNGKNTHFDPYLVDIFLSIRQDIYAIFYDTNKIEKEKE